MLAQIQARPANRACVLFDSEKTVSASSPIARRVHIPVSTTAIASSTLGSDAIATAI